MHNLKKTLETQANARKRIPGLTQLLSKSPIQFGLGVWPGYYDSASGVTVKDLDDNVYTDMSIGGIGATVLGYADSDVDNAVISAIRKGSACSLNCREEVLLAEKLCELHPWAEMARFARCGGEAMAIAVRIARTHTRRDKIAFCGYHGWHDWYLAANLSENSLDEHLLPGLAPLGVPRGLLGTALPFHYNNIDELKKIIADNCHQIAAIVMEPIRNMPPLPGFLKNVKQIAAEAGAVLIFDEVSAAFRLNPGGAHLKLGVQPDIAVFSKALGNGYPIAAIIGTGKVMTSAQYSFISSTMWTERIGPVAALATIEKYIKCNVHEHLIAIGSVVQDGWRAAAAKHGIEINIGGIPPLSHFEFAPELQPRLKALFVQFMLEKGFLASTIFYPMYAHSMENVRAYLVAVDETFAIIAGAVKSGQIDTLMQGQPTGSGFARLT